MKLRSEPLALAVERAKSSLQNVAARRNAAASRAPAATPSSAVHAADGFGTPTARRPLQPLSERARTLLPQPVSARPPIDVQKPFDAKREAALLDAAIAGEDNHWAIVRRYVGEDGPTWAAHIKDAIREFSPEHVEELYVRAFHTVVATRLEQSRDVRRYLERLPDPVERGPAVHYYVGDMGVPEGKEHGTFVDLADMLPILQGRPPPKSRLEAVVRDILDRSGVLPEDLGLGFDRVMLTPFDKEDGQDGGYSQIDPLHVDERYNGDPEHQLFMAEAVRRTVEVIADRIPNHNSRYHERTQALLNGDLSRLAEHINWSGAVKVGEEERDGQQINRIVHTGEDVGAVSKVWAIFPDNNPDSLVRVTVPLRGEWRDLEKVKAAVGPAFALDDEAQRAVRAVFHHHGMPEAGEDGRWFLPEEAKASLVEIREENNARVLAELQAELDAGREPQLDIHLMMSFMANVQYDKNLAHPAVVAEELEALARAARLGQTGIRLDAIIHAGKVPGTDQLAQPMVKGFMRYVNAVTELMSPRRVLVPEAFLPPEIIQQDWLDPHLEIGGRKHPTMGDMAIAFRSAITNTETVLTGDATHFVDYVQGSVRGGEQLGNGLAYAVRLHDEALMSAELRSSLTVIDPLDELEAFEAELCLRGEEISVDVALDYLREVLERPSFTDFANRAVGDDASVVLGTPERLAQSIALSYAGPDIPAVSARLLVGAGNNVDFALQQMRGRLEDQRKAGQRMDFRRAFDARDLGRGPIPRALWEQRIQERYLPLELTRALNTLWDANPSVRTRQVQVLRNQDPAIAVFARGAEGTATPGLLQVFNVSDEARTVRLSKEDLATALGWDAADVCALRDLLGDALAGKGASSAPFALQDEGSHYTFELGPNAQVFLQKAAPRRSRLAEALTSARS